MNPQLLTLYLVTDERLPWCICLERIGAAVRGGITMVQLRCKQDSYSVFAEKTYEALALLRPLGIPLIVNDRVEIADICGAQGVHLGKDDCSVKEARCLLGPDAIIGFSWESDASLDADILSHCDYVAASPVFSTSTKMNIAQPFGAERLRFLKKSCPLPLVAIGGINNETVSSIAETGIDGIAVVSAIMQHQDAETAARELKERFLKRKITS